MVILEIHGVEIAEDTNSHLIAENIYPIYPHGHIDHLLGFGSPILGIDLS